MTEKYFTIIIKDSDKDTAIESLRSQSFNDWECFIISNTNKNTEKLVSGDTRIKIITKSNKYDGINEAIKIASGKYIIILNSYDYFIPNALSCITQMTIPTESDVVLYGTTTTEEIPELPDKEYKCDYRYLVRRESIMDFVFDSLSGFCFKKEFLQDKIITSPEEEFTFKILANISAVTKTRLVCVLQTKHNLDLPSKEYKKLIDNFVEYKNNFNKKFWKKYFSILIIRIIYAYIYQHDKDTYVYCASKIPLKYIPLKYKLSFGLLKLIHKKI